MNRANIKKLSVPQQAQRQSTKGSVAVPSYKSKYSPYQKFLNSINPNAPETTKTYVFHLKKFLEFSRFNDYPQLLEIPDEQKTDLIQEFIQSYKKRGLSYQTINSAFASIKLFYEANGIEYLPWKRLSRQKGKRKRVIDDRLYTDQELKRLVEYANVPEKVAVLTMLSSGMRIGALAALKWGDVKEIPEYGIYRFRPYSDDLEERYTTFCTPECAKYIRQYRQDREDKEGETVTNSSPFIIHKTMTTKRIKNKGFYKPQALAQIFERLRYRASIMSPEKIGNNKTKQAGLGKLRKEVMRTHVFRKMFTTACNGVGMNTTIKEKLLGHKTGPIGLDVTYDKTPEDVLLREYLKVIDSLTVDDTNRLRQKTVQLEKEIEEINALKKQLKDSKKELEALWENQMYSDFTIEGLTRKLKHLEKKK